MTAKQRAARAKFKAVVKEASKLRKKNPKLTQAQAVKQAFAISYERDRRNPIKRIKKTVTDYVTKFKEDVKKGYYGEEYGKKRRRRKVGAAPTKVKAKKSKRTSEMHTDTKSHNVNIRVMSGVEPKNMYAIRDQYENDIKVLLEAINRIKNNLPNMDYTEKNRANRIIEHYKKVIIKLKKRLRDQNKLINELLK